MPLIIETLTLIIGVIIILICAGFAVKSSMKIAQYFGLSYAFIGMTVLAIGTSFPEIFTHFIGSLDILREPRLLNEMSGLLIGTNLGSDIAQQLFILSLIAIIVGLRVEKKRLGKDVGALIGASFLLLLFGINGFISRIEGAVLLFGYIGYIIYLSKGEKSKVEYNRKKIIAQWKNIGILLFIFVIIGFVAEKVLRASIIILETLNISASFFGIVTLGIAAAIPELTTSFVAMKKGKGAISAGILIGSNVTNPMFSLGLGAMLSTYTVPSVVVLFDLPVKIVTGIMIYLFLRPEGKLTKPKAAFLLALYFLYIVGRRIYFPVDF